MTASTWIGTPKALYRMARHGGDDWNRLYDSLPSDQRRNLSRLNKSVETLRAEAKYAKDVDDREGSVRWERQRLRRPWEEARRVALEPSESFKLATRLVDFVQSESTQEFRSKELGKRLDEDVNSPTFLEALELSVTDGFIEWTAVGKIRAVSVGRLRARSKKLDSLNAPLAKMCARLRVLRVAPLWMLHENGSAESTPTEFETISNQLIPRQDGLMWAGPGIAATTSVDLESLHADEIWPIFKKKERGIAEIEGELSQAKSALKEALKTATAELWARREPAEDALDEADEGSPDPGPEAAQGLACTRCAQRCSADAAFCTYCGAPLTPVRSCQGCGSEQETDGRYCPDCGTEYEVKPVPKATDRRGKRPASPAPQPALEIPKGIPANANQTRRFRRASSEQNDLRIRRF